MTAGPTPSSSSIDGARPAPRGDGGRTRGGTGRRPSGCKSLIGCPSKARGAGTELAVKVAGVAPKTGSGEHGMNRILPLALMVLAAGTPAIAQDGFRHGRIAYLEAGVTLQRATEAGSEEATPNLPFLPGDRVWTDDAGRVEFQFLDRTFVRLDRRSKLDYATHEEGRTERIILRLWSGSLYLRSRNSDNPLFGIETPGGLVLTQERGVYRVDVDSGETRLSVHEGEATLEGGRRRVTVGAGERSYARRGDSPERPRPFDRGEADEFARWE